MSVEVVDDRAIGVLPCSVNPDWWDIEPCVDVVDSAVRWANVRKALLACTDCPALRWCAEQAVANPPLHHCVQGGLIWPGLSSSKREKARHRANRPIPFEEWHPPMVHGFALTQAREAA